MRFSEFSFGRGRRRISGNDSFRFWLSLGAILFLSCGNGLFAEDPENKTIPESTAVEIQEVELSEQANTLSALDAVILGVVEGITEYLPVSSTGHLIISADLLGLQEEIPVNPSDPESLTMKQAVDGYLIIIQFGAIAAVGLLYFKRFWGMVEGLLGRNPGGLKMVLLLLTAFCPAAILGLLAGDWIDHYLFYPWPVAIALGLGGLVMIFLDKPLRRGAREGKDLEDLSFRDALVIGGLQCLALWPGTSRSLTTILGGMVVGLTPARAAEFSFLLGFVTLTAASLYKTLQVGAPLLEAFGWQMPLLGIVVAAVSAALAVKGLVHFLNRFGLSLFGWYRLVLAGILLITWT